MSPHLDTIVREIETSHLLEAQTLEELQEGMANRAPLFALLSQIDPFELEPPEKARLRRALQDLAATDKQVRERLEAEQRGIAEMLDSVAEARGAVRGYRGGPRATGAVLRTA